MADYYTPIQIGLAAASAVMYSAVGYQVGRRPASANAELAKHMFQSWWYGLAGLSLFAPAVAVLVAVHLDTFSTMMVLIQILLIVIFAAIAGLVYYLLYLYTGRRWVLGAVVAYFIIMVVWLEYLLLTADISGWGTPPDGGAKTFLDANGQRIETDPLQGLVFGLLVAVPPLLSAVAFFMLYFKVNDPEPKYRIAVVSAALVLWFGSTLVGSLTGLSQNPETQQPWQVVSGIVGLLSATAVYMAYKPPAWIRKRLENGGSAPNGS